MSYHNNLFYAASPGHHSYPGQALGTPSAPSRSYSGGHGYYSTPRTPSRTNNGDPSITSSFPSTFGGGDTPTSVTLGKAVSEGTSTIDFNVIKTTKKEVHEKYVTEIFGPSPSKEAIDPTFPNEYKSKYLNDLGEEVYDQSIKCSEREKWDKISTLERDTTYYCSILEPVVLACNGFIERNEQYLAQIAAHGDPELLEVAKARMDEVKLLASDLSRKQDALKKFRTWLVCRMEGESQGEPQDIQAILQVVQEIQQSFTFSANVTIQYRLEQLLKDEFVQLRNQFRDLASDASATIETLQGFYTPFRINDSAFDKETLHVFYFLLYKVVQSADVDVSGMLQEARKKGLVHKGVTQMVEIDSKNRIKYFEWYKYFVLVVFGFYQELQVILAKSSLNGKKAVLAYSAEAEKGNWIILIDGHEDISPEFAKMNVA